MSAVGPGIRVKCVKVGAWRNSYGLGDGPTFGSVWTVSEVKWFPAVPGLFPKPAGDYFKLVEWPGGRRWFKAIHFVPLRGNEDIFGLESLLDIQADRTLEPAQRRTVSV